MLDIKFIVENAELVKENTRRRGYEDNVDALLSADASRRSVLSQIESLRREGNEIADRAKKDAVFRESARDEARRIKEQVAELQVKHNEIQENFRQLLARIPNMLDKRVPLGDEDAFELVREWGDIPQFAFVPRPHEEIGASLNMIDIERGVRMAGTRFYVLKNAAVRLRYAMIRLFCDQVAGPEWQLVSPPFLAKDQTLFTAGYLPFADKDNYRIAGEDLSLIGTSEQAILGFHMDEILAKVPLCYLGDSMCFRTEAGAAGRDTRGIIRVHQFYKLEQIVFCHPSESEAWHLKCRENEERFLQLLRIPYRVIICPSGDIAAPGAFKYDIEAWMPSQERYREVTSNTNLTDYQSRRGNIRFRSEDGERVFPHTISATGFCDRHLLAVLENYQTEKGTVKIPEALVPYMGMEEIVG